MTNILLFNLSFYLGEESETNQRYKFMGLCGLYVFYIILFKGMPILLSQPIHPSFPHNQSSLSSKNANKFDMYLHISDLTDKKFFKSLWEVHKKVPVLHLYGDVVWFPNDFFSKTVPTMVKLIKNPDVPSFQRSYIKQMDKDFPV